MFWADKVAEDIIKSGKYKPFWVDDMKTLSGRPHTGALMGVVIHDLVYRALQDKGQDAEYTYVFENHDPMDDIPSYLDRSKYEQYLGMPLFKIPSPVPGFASFPEYYGDEFKKTFNTLGSYPTILWTKDLYTSGKMNKGIKLVLDNAAEVRKIYSEMYKKEIAKDWYPFQVYCEQCGKVSTTKVYDWDGKNVHYRCTDLDWTKGCGYEGKTSPFSSESGMKGKMPWKVEWAAKWQAIGVTIEGAGKDHMSKGGSHDLASEVATRVLNYPVPYSVGYEFMLIGGKKMSSSKGRGFSAADILTILPPTLARFLIVKMDINQQTNFDPTEPETIPRLFDDYQKYAEHYFESKKDDYARTFELSQIGEVKKPPQVSFMDLVQLIKKNDQEKIKKAGAEEWVKYVTHWLENYAPEEERVQTISKEVPKEAESLTAEQKQFLSSLAQTLDIQQSAEDMQRFVFDSAKKHGLSGKDAFAAIYLSLFGKTSGPKAGQLLFENKDLVKKRFEEIPVHKEESGGTEQVNTSLHKLNNKELFSFDPQVKTTYPSISVGIAVIKGVLIKKEDHKLEEAKGLLLKSLQNLSTEDINTYKEVVSYRNLYRQMGIDWHSRRPSPEALLRRITQGKELYTINTCVDAYNLVVVKNKVSIGAFDFNKLTFPTVLKFPSKGDEILLLGDIEPTKYKETELAYFDQNGGYNIDFNYRDAKRTSVTEQTRNIYLNVDGVFDITPEKVQKVLQQACDEITRYCGGKVTEFGLVTAL